MATISDGRRAITPTSEVQTSYYGLPVIKAAHWRWLVITYLFLGGIAGAGYTIATIATIANLYSKDRAVERVARYISFAAFLPCPVLLILDLGRPERFLHMLRILKLRSPMSLGSWVLSLFGGFSALSAGLQLLADLRGPDTLARPRQILGIAGLPFSVFLSGYTGVLLAATNVPLWWRASPFLSPTFISSAYSTSLAAISVALGLGPEREDTVRKLARAEAVCLTVELATMTGVVVKTGKIGKPLTGGKLGAIFWPVTYLGGVVIPLILQLAGPARGKTVPREQRIATAMLTLIGGFALRALMVFAGRESANRPQDYFEMTRRPSTQREAP